MTSTQLDFLRVNEEAQMTLRLKEAIAALKEGKPILLQDDSDRENEADLIMAAEKIDSVSMNFLIQNGSGIVCLALSPEKVAELGLTLMVPDNTNAFQTAFCVSIEANNSVSTGISAQDRAQTFRMAMADNAKSSDFKKPGHVFPIAAKANGVLERMGHTEGSIDLMNIAGLKRGAALCELMNGDGSMALGHQCSVFAQKHGIATLTIEEILFHRLKTEKIVDWAPPKRIDSRFGPLLWYRFVFFDGSELEFFVRETFTPDQGFQRLYLATGENISLRFMAQLLHGHDDDPLIDGLKKLSEQQSDIVVMMPTSFKNSSNNANEKRRHLAFLCRALKELSVKNISVSAPQQFSAIAEHFALSTNSVDKICR